MKYLLWLASVAFALGACSSTDDPSTADAATNGDAQPGVDAASVSDAIEGCHDLVNVAEPVETQQVAENAPAATGGEITYGVYKRIENTIYTGPGGATGPAGTTRETIYLGQDGTFHQVVTDPLSEDRAAGDYTTSGSEFALDVTCGRPLTVVPYTAYSASGGEVSLSGEVQGTFFATTYELVVEQ